MYRAHRPVALRAEGRGAIETRSRNPHDTPCAHPVPMTTGAVALEVASSEVFARRPRRLLPPRIGCAVVTYSTEAPPSRCNDPAATAADAVCRSCGPRRVFLCDSCVAEIRWGVGAGSVWCATDGALVTAVDGAISLTG